MTATTAPVDLGDQLATAWAALKIARDNAPAQFRDELQNVITALNTVTGDINALAWSLACPICSAGINVPCRCGYRLNVAVQESQR
ncbi:hypothetical protein [Mycolicibacterium brumae]|uniref:Uncharacterized protein n=1 Tax=Mycolicibacterium brumae TaxID=85968 RepID=A0A2G5PBK3_9MYCO|nr:hypothetical protein [Mycolicibacterium brumae]MCV7191490.1 hypothetical protein [Mycolicibacterium brumae]PIB75705.1 hypothetical protein CQY22_008165 [Mycolicibacterium brumae]RWA16203.1 hypothetical protein MBRU_08835 [Mycolicibacterium brumae DSM 44177]UWW09403.1 hypothetical protein L2Z93_002500 [Mycolicibacterium brumae]